MSTAEIKNKIQQVLDKVPESTLADILDYLEKIEVQAANQTELDKNIDKIFSENKGLLERLAQ